MAAPLRILHVEDNPLDAELLHEKLRKIDLVFDVQRVATRAEFLATIEQGGFDLILCNYALPSSSCNISRRGSWQGSLTGSAKAPASR